MTPAQKALLEKRDGWEVGRDPRAVSRDELIAAGHKPMSAQKALRLRCIDCKAGDVAQVRRCAHLDCPASPFRTGKNPWRKEPSEAQRERGRTLARTMAAGVPGALSRLEQIAKSEVPATTLPGAKLCTGETASLGDPACGAAGSKATLQEALRAAGYRPMSPLRALRLRCLDCCLGSANEVRLCTAVSCPAWPFRLGSSPWRPPASEARQEAQRQAGARLALRQSAPTVHRGETQERAAPATTLPAEPSVRPDAQRERAFQTQATLSVEDAR